jgi:hypothetical protein
MEKTPKYPAISPNGQPPSFCVNAQLYPIQGQPTLGQAFADSVRLAFEEPIRVVPEDGPHIQFLIAGCT